MEFRLPYLRRMQTQGRQLDCEKIRDIHVEVGMELLPLQRPEKAGVVVSQDVGNKMALTSDAGPGGGDAGSKQRLVVLVVAESGNEHERRLDFLDRQARVPFDEPDQFP